MANGTRTLSLLIVLVVGLAAGWLLGRSKPIPAPKPLVKVGPHLVVVGPKAKDLSEDVAEISQKNGDTVRWAAQNPKHTLTITFRLVDFDPAAPSEPPFMGQNGQAQPGQDLVITCTRNTFCDPGPINPRLPKLTGLEKLTYKYGQKLDSPNGDHDEADGWIIIKP